MKKHLVRSLAALALAATGLSSQAANIKLSGWTFGSGNAVLANAASGDYAGAAGGFVGTLTGAPGYDAAPFNTFSIELEEHFAFGEEAVTGYRLVEGARYFQVRRGDVGIAQRLGRLMTFAYDNPDLVQNAEGSTALQLAIWNTVYDTDDSLGSGGSFGDASAYATAAEALLVGARGVAASRFEVFALERAGSQDLLLLEPNPNAPVPEPGSMALVLAALGGLAVARRRSTSCGAARG